MADQYDAIIIGAGHNGLTAAATLAMAGLHVLVVEARDNLGGAAATEELFPGYRANIGSETVSLLQEEVIRALFLKMHGLELRETPIGLFAPQPDGTALTLWQDVTHSEAEIAFFSHHDAARYPDFAAQVATMAGALQSMMLLAPPDLAELDPSALAKWGRVGWKVRRLGDRDMMAFMRLLPMPLKDYLDEWFESDALKGALGAAGVTGTMLGPRGGGTTLQFLYQNLGGLNRYRTVAGGTGRLAEALGSAAQANGAEIRCGSPVARILVDDGRATGVELAGGASIQARAVVSGADPKRTFLGLVGPTKLPPRFMRQVRNILYRGSTARVHFALSALPQFRGQAREEQLSAAIRISPSLDYLERAYDDAKYGRISENLYLEAAIPSVADPYLAPAGHHLLSVTVRYTPYRLRDSNWEEQREPLGDRVLATLARYAPGIEQLVVDRHVLTPLDYEQRYGLTEGSIFHGQMGLDQMLVMRPVPGWSRYRTPIANLYLCGAGAHPGGGVTGAPGYNAARAILRDIKG
ncbi:MAG: NAD(P)/FAD-dependent oxidoreductase [Anaerolineae bacterium]|nr:NAD(P)/FAD-dependent oxidoreductase [Anaerolineae bacterium]